VQLLGKERVLKNLLRRVEQYDGRGYVLVRKDLRRVVKRRTVVVWKF